MTGILAELAGGLNVSVVGVGVVGVMPVKRSIVG